MHHDSPRPHIILQIICMIIALFGALALWIDIFIGTVLIGGAVTIFALDWLYLASDKDGK